MNLIEIKNLKTYFHTEGGIVKAVDDVSLSIPVGKTLGVVGESGCGKSVTAMSILQLVSPPGRIDGGEILLYDNCTASPQDTQTTASDQSALPDSSASSGTPSAASPTSSCVDLVQMSEAQIRKIRGKRIAMIFQEPMSSLNPVFTVGYQIVEAVQLHNPHLTSKQAWDIAVDMLDKVRIPDPARRAEEFPHQYSGGMRQRAMIAMALSCKPDLLIADEPTTALDVTIQAQILDLLRHLQETLGMSILIITHDLGIIAETAHEVAVMYASKIVEKAPADELFASPKHPYTLGLLKSRPELSAGKHSRLYTIPGMVPLPTQFPPGCKFHARCPYCQEKCKVEEPELRMISENHSIRCHFDIE